MKLFLNLFMTLLFVATSLTAQDSFFVEWTIPGCANLIVTTSEGTFVVSDTATIAVDCATSDIIEFDANGCVNDAQFTVLFGSTLTTVDINGPNLQWEWIVDCGALPLSIVNMYSHVDGNNVTATLVTADRTNVEYITLERLVRNDWIPVVSTHTVEDGASIMSFDMRITDLKPGTHYLRFNIVDWDGSNEYSPIMAATVYGDKDVSVYPNPSNGGFTVESDQDATVEVISLLGSVLDIVDVDANTPLSLDLGLSNGTYLIRLSSGGDVITTRRLVIAE